MSTQFSPLVTHCASCIQTASPCSAKEACSVRPMKITWTSSPVKLPRRFQCLLSILLLSIIDGTAFQTSFEELCTTIVQSL